MAPSYCVLERKMMVAPSSTSRQGPRWERTALRQPKLLHHARLVPLFPALDYSAVSYAIENEAVDSHAATGRWDIPKRGTVRSFCDPSCSHLTPRDDLIFDGNP